MKVIWAFLLIVIWACTAKNTSYYSRLNTSVDSTLLTAIENDVGKKFRNLTKVIWVADSTNSDILVSIDSVQTNGIELSFIEDSRARQIVRKYCQKVNQAGYYIYLKNLDFNEKYSSFYDIAIVKVADQFELVKFAETEAVNYNQTNEAIIERLREWNKEDPFRIIVADYDRIEADFIKLPKDRLAFAKEVYAFCPDVIDQGIGSEEELAEYFRKENSFWLWWD